MRLFVAIPIPDAITQELVAGIERIGRQPCAQELHWFRPAGWHITLQFLGNSSSEAFQCLARALQEIHARAPTIVAAGAGVFERAGVLYAGVKRTPDLLALEKAVVNSTSDCGFVRELRAYTPHITLAKMRSRSSIAALSRFLKKGPELLLFSSFRTEEICLYESTPRSSGEYVIRQRIALA